MATRQQPPTNQNKNIVSKIETENKMLNNIFQQVFSEKQLKQRVISIKFWITFIIGSIHILRHLQMTIYDNRHSVLEIHPLPLTRLNSTTQPIYLF